MTPMIARSTAPRACATSADSMRPRGRAGAGGQSHGRGLLGHRRSARRPAWALGPGSVSPWSFRPRPDGGLDCRPSPYPRRHGRGRWRPRPARWWPSPSRLSGQNPPLDASCRRRRAQVCVVSGAANWIVAPFMTLARKQLGAGEIGNGGVKALQRVAQIR